MKDKIYVRTQLMRKFPEFIKDTNWQIQEAEGIPTWINRKQSITRYITVKLQKTKGEGKILIKTETT